MDAVIRQQQQQQQQQQQFYEQCSNNWVNVQVSYKCALKCHNDRKLLQGRVCLRDIVFVFSADLSVLHQATLTSPG